MSAGIGAMDAAAEAGSGAAAGQGDGGQAGAGAEGTPSGDAGGEGAGDAGAGNGADSGSAGSEGSPETYADFTTKEGFELGAERLGKITELFREGKVTQELAQKLIDESTSQAEGVAEQVVESIEKSQADADKAAFAKWDDEMQSDPKFGGDRLDQTQTEAASFIKMFGDGEDGAEFKDRLEKTGLDRCPWLIRAFARAGLHFSEANSNANEGGGGGGEDNRSPAERAYNSDGSARSYKKWGEESS